MAFEAHPWFIGLEGVEHSAEVARLLAWAATSGATGIIEPTDLQVRAQPVPDGSVRIMPGGFAVKSKYSGAGQQSYVGRAPSQTTVEVPATGSSGGATRYVVVRIQDPDFPGGGTVPPNPEAANAAVYTTPMLTPSGFLNSSNTQVVLARIDQPANTGTITQSMITDLRELAMPQRKEFIFARPRVQADNSSQNWLGARESNGGEYFPGGGGYANEFTITTPEWATHVAIEADWMGVRYTNGKNAYGGYWVEFGDEYKPHTWPGKQQFEFSTQHFQFDTVGKAANTYRGGWRLMDVVPIKAALRGKNTTFVFKAGLADAAETQSVSLGAMSGLGMRLTFTQQAITSDLI